MLKTSRTLVAALVVLFSLGAALPASAQTATSQKGRATRGASSAKVKKVARPSARSSTPRARSSTARTQSIKARTWSQPTATRRTVTVNRAPTQAERTRNALRSAYGVNRTTAVQAKSTVRNGPSDAEKRMKELFRRPANDSNRRVADNERNRQRDPYRRGYNDDRRRRPRPYDGGYRSGYRSGYRDGYRSGSYYGLCYGRCYRHHHYYGPRLVFGWHYGGFGFYHGRWHFAIVIGGPVYVRHHHYRYNYSWWDGRYSSLYTWNRAMEVHPANYSFAAGSCVELWLRTTDKTDYEIKVDPGYWNARDPGELYAALWAELDKEGQLQIVDVNGAVHIFPAGMIQQIEARPCN